MTSRRSPPSAPPTCVAGRGCSTRTPIATTIARSTRSPAPPGVAGRRAGRRRAHGGGADRPQHRARHPPARRRAGRRAGRLPRRGPPRRRRAPRRWPSPNGWGRRSGLPGVLVRVARRRSDARRSCAAAASPSCAVGSPTASSRPTSARRDSHPTAGAVLVAARPPLVAFNLELAPPATLADARAIAALVREGGAEGLPGVRALGLELTAQGAIAQVSTNVEDHRAVPLAQLVAAVARHAPVAACELVGLAPAAAFDGFPETMPVKGRRTVEDGPRRRRLRQALGAIVQAHGPDEAQAPVPSTAATPRDRSRCADGRARQVDARQGRQGGAPRSPRPAADVALGRPTGRRSRRCCSSWSSRCCSTTCARGAAHRHADVPALHRARASTPTSASTRSARPRRPRGSRRPWTSACSPSGRSQENAFLRAARRQRPGAAGRPRRGGAQAAGRHRGARRHARRDPAHAPPLRPHRRGRARGQGDRRARLLPRARGSALAGHHGLRAVAGLRPVRVLGSRAHRRRRRAPPAGGL